jgi:hypothetical protein
MRRRSALAGLAQWAAALCLSCGFLLRQRRIARTGGVKRQCRQKHQFGNPCGSETLTLLTLLTLIKERQKEIE